MRLVTFPLILPGISAGAVLAFVLSIDDFITTYLLTSGTVQTFPVQVWGTQKLGLPPTANAVGTLIFFGGLLLALLNALTARRRPA